MKASRWLPSLILTLTLASSAAATHGGIHPTFKSEGVYFHCTGDTPVYQVNWAAQAGAASSYATWDGTPPPGSVTDGNGCGGWDAGGASNEFGDPVFEGTFTGNIRNMTVRIYDFIVANTRQGTTQQLKVYAEIDGVPLFPRGATEGIYDGRTVTVTPSRGNSGATDLYEFTITNIGYANKVKDAGGNVIDVETGGAAQENGTGTMEHTIKLLIGLAGGIGGEQPTGMDFFVWDMTEVPSGITFNPSTPAAATVAADLPNLG